MRLNGRRALVTGAARGIGRGCALELARAGADVAINDRLPSPETESLVAEIEALGQKAVLVAGDAFSRPACESIVARAIDALGGLEILVSNPAFSQRNEFLDFDPQMFERVLQGTLVSGFHISQLVARHLVERGRGGKIVFISSIHARIPYARSIAYNAGKSGLNNMAFTIAAELVGHRINVNVIEPGWIDTPGERGAFGDDAIEKVGPGLPWGRMGTPSDIGRAAVFLCSDDAAYITGTSLVVDGGLVLRPALEENPDPAKGGTCD